MEVHLIDGTYELFRHYHGAPKMLDREGREVGAVRGVLGSLRMMLRQGATHIGIATDHVIESFRNNLWPGYKTGAGTEPDLLAQFPLLEEVLTAYGFQVWPMVEFEADDALASAAVKAAEDPRVDRVLICTPDKDLAQCVRGTRIVQMDRRKQIIRDESGVVEKFGVPPSAIPDYLALVGDSADGFPGLRGWGEKSASNVLAAYGHLEQIPRDSGSWSMRVSGAPKLAATLRDNWEQALLFRNLATLRSEIPLFQSVDELFWKHPTAAWPAVEARLKSASAHEKQGGLS
jgi:5'-3' exonuclease